MAHEPGCLFGRMASGQVLSWPTPFCRRDTISSPFESVAKLLMPTSTPTVCQVVGIGSGLGDSQTSRKYQPSKRRVILSCLHCPSIGRESRRRQLPTPGIVILSPLIGQYSKVMNVFPAGRLPEDPLKPKQVYETGQGSKPLVSYITTYSRGDGERFAEFAREPEWSLRLNLDPPCDLRVHDPVILHGF